MATDIGRINAAMGGIRALDYQGSETREVLSHLGALVWVVKKDQAERDKERLKKAEDLAKAPEFLRCAADYQDAPVGTKIAKRFGSGWWEKYEDVWADENGATVRDSHIAAAPRKVVKWGGE
jgi:hypothetical protein